MLSREFFRLGIVRCERVASQLRRVSIAGALLLLGSTSAQAMSCDDARQVGDVLRYALPASAYALNVGYQDAEGAFQFTKTLAFTGIGTGVFKKIGEKHRPDAGKSEQSFVSGHVSASMAGASFIYTRYGKAWGVPAYFLAGFTAYSRYCSDKHFDDDILGGTMVALMSNWYATSPYPTEAQLLPSFTSNELNVSFKAFFGGNRQPRDPSNFKARYKFVFEFGPLQTTTNLVRSPNEGAPTYDLADLELNTAATARLLFEYYPAGRPRDDWSVYYSPLGITEFDTPTETVSFAGTDFDPAEYPVFNTNYRWFDFRGRWRTAVVSNDRWSVKLGGGLQYSQTKVEFEQGIQGQVLKQSEVSVGRLYPVIHGAVGYQLSDRWSLDAEVDGMSAFWDSNNEYNWNSGLKVSFKASPLWDLGLGARLIVGKLDDEDLFNKIEANEIVFSLGRAF